MDWYDAHWWQTHAWARACVVAQAPAVLADFDAAVERLRPVPGIQAEFLPGRVPEDIRTDMVQRLRAMDPTRLESHELDTFGRHVVHDAYTDLIPWAQAIVEEVVGVPVEASYDFLSLYHGTGVCEPHLDAPNAVYTLDVLLEQSAAWPLLVAPDAPWIPDVSGTVRAPSFDDRTVAWRELVMEPGDAVVFAGPAVWHGRRAMARQDPPGWCNLAFFHFIPRGTADVVDPRRWAELFDVPRLDRVVDLLH